MGHKELEAMKEHFAAMETPEKYKQFVTAKNQLFTGKINQERVQKFAEYTTGRFLDACNDKSVFGSFQNWENKTSDEKIQIAEKITAGFLERIIDDIWNDRVQIYTRDGSEYHKTNEQVDRMFKQDIAVMPKLKFQARNISHAMMGVSRDGNFYIATDDVFYSCKSATFFLMDLKHELTHVIDMFLSNISPLEPDVLQDAQMFYANPVHYPDDLYRNNPMELNANQSRRDLRIRIEQMLAVQDAALQNTASKNR